MVSHICASTVPLGYSETDPSLFPLLCPFPEISDHETFFACQKMWYIPVKTFAFENPAFLKNSLVSNFFSNQQMGRRYMFFCVAKKKIGKAVDFISV